MTPQRKLFLFVTLFVILSLLSLSVQFLLPKSPFAQVTKLLDNPWANCLILLIVFFLLALGLTGLIDFIHKRSVKRRWRRTKIGEILISEGYITEEQLHEVLSEQNLRIGELLLRGRRITAHQLNHSLERKKETSRELGEILRELGYVTEEDLSWALEKQERNLGEILRDKGLITDYELRRVLALQRHGPREL
jgi:aspartate ammonia-lyase